MKPGMSNLKGIAELIQTWDLPARQVYMSSDTYRDVVILGLTESGSTREEAESEADRRLAVMASEEPDSPKTSPEEDNWIAVDQDAHGNRQYMCRVCGYTTPWVKGRSEFGRAKPHVCGSSKEESD